MKLSLFVLVFSIFSVLDHFVLTTSKDEEESQALELKTISEDSEERNGENEDRNSNIVEHQDAEILVHGREQVQRITRYRRQLRPVVDNSSSKAPQELICPESLSCKNNCSAPRRVLRVNEMSCFCDKDCDFFKDCCADFDKHCVPMNRSQSKPISNQEGLVNSENKDLWGCYDGEAVKGTSGFWMIGSCPKSWPKDDIFFQCRNLSVANKITKDNYRYLPVYTSNGRVYHNRYCAQCNGIASKDLMYYKLSIKCSVIPLGSLSKDKQIEYLFTHCQSNKINWAAHRGSPRRFCITLTEHSISCKRDVDGKCTNGLARIVSVLDDNANYKNKHCADLCDGSGKYDCGPRKFETTGTFFPQAKPFSIIFDFGNNNEETRTLKVNCPDGNPFYDPYLQICRAGRAPTPQSLREYEEYEIILWLQAVNPVSQNLIDIIKFRPAIDSKAAGNILKIHHEQLRKCKMSSMSDILFTFKLNLNVSIEKTNSTRTRRSLETTKDQYIDRIINFKAPFGISFMPSINFTVFKVTSRILGCVNLQQYSRHEYTVLSSDRSAVVIIKTKEILKSNEFYTLNDTAANDSQGISVCRHHQTSNCSAKWVLINEGEFVVLENKTVFVNSSRHVFDLSNYIWENHSVFVCENFSKTYHKRRNVPVTKTDDSPLVHLTYVCMLISIIALVFVLVTYSLFTELRTPPGINLMNLSVSILLAQLLWILGSGQTDKPVACTVIAVLLHYFFLVSFVWTSIIAFDTWRAFTTKGRPSLAGSKRKRIVHCLRYMAVGWICVMVYVAICVVLDITKSVKIGYQSSKACWMANPLAILYTFAIPVALILIFNVTFYVMTLKAIKASTAQARAATDHKDRKHTFGIYVRIASAMCFTWVVGFIAPFGAHFLWYPFVILNCLQGLYIALSFGLNQRARNLYKNRFPVLARLSSNTVNSDSTKSTSKFEKLSEERKVEDTKL